jgi:hypothetical protein
MSMAKVLQRTVRILDKLEVEYALTGMHASGVHGYRRATEDIDVVLLVDEPKWKQVVEEFKKHGYLFRHGDFHKLGFATLKTPECLGVDLIVEDDPEVFERAFDVEYYGMMVPIVSLEDLVRSKLRFRRSIDIIDLQRLLEIRGGDVDWKYLDRKVTDSEESDLLNRLRRGEEIMVKLRRGPREFCPRSRTTKQ